MAKDNKDKQLRELSEKELKQVTGGANVLTFDLGGGTFDVSIMDVNYGVCIDAMPDENGMCSQR